MPQLLVHLPKSNLFYQISRLRIERGSANANYLMFVFAEQKRGTSIPVEVVARVGSSSTGEKLFAGLGASGSATTYRISIGLLYNPTRRQVHQWRMAR